MFYQAFESQWGLNYSFLGNNNIIHERCRPIQKWDLGVFIFIEHIRKLTIEFLCLFEVRLSNTLSILPFQGWDTLGVFLLKNLLSKKFSLRNSSTIYAFYTIMCKKYQVSSWLAIGRGAKWSCSKLTINCWLGLGRYTAIFILLLEIRCLSHFMFMFVLPGRTLIINPLTW